MIIFIIISHSLLCQEVWSLEKKNFENLVSKIKKQKKYHYAELTSPHNNKQDNSPWSKFWEKVKNFFKKFFNYFIKYMNPLISFLIIILIILFIYGCYFSIKKLNPEIEKKHKSEKKLKFKKLNFQQIFLLGNSNLNSGKYKAALKLYLKALWLYLHLKQIVLYSDDLTNRELLTSIKSDYVKSLINSLIFEAEIAIYKNKCIDINETEIFRNKISGIFNNNEMV